MHKRLSALLSVFALVALVVFSGCDPEKPVGPDDPPVDGDPVVTLVSPTTGYALAKKGETVSITFELHDNELLASYDATEKWTSVTGQVVQTEQSITGEYAVLSTNSVSKTIDYQVPTTGIQVYSTIEIVAYATDNKGKTASAKFKINVIPDVNDTTQYLLEEYTGDTIWSILTGSNYNFDIINRMSGDDQQIPNPNRYLREVSTVPGNVAPLLSSPIWNGADSVLVTTNTSMFNYDEADYETMWEAFVTSNRIGAITDTLNVNDVVILKMPNLPHFAAFLIKHIEGASGCGCVGFDYKYSYQ